MGKKVLIVDDDPALRRLISYSFQKEYTFVEASTVAEAVRCLDEDPGIHVIILDLDLRAGGKGTALLDRIKEHSARYKVIVQTAHDEILPPDAAGELDVFVYLTKMPRDKSQSQIPQLRFALRQAFKDISITEHLKVQKAINSNEELKAILDLICKLTLERIDGYVCHIRLFDLKKGDYVVAGYWGPPEVESLFGRPKKLSESVSGRVAEANVPTVIDDLQGDEEFVKMKERVLGEGGLNAETLAYLDTVASAYIVPISTGIFENNEVDAVFNISSTSTHFFTPEKQKVIDDFVVQVNLAIAKEWLRHKRDEVHKDYSDSSNLLEQISEQLKGPDILQNIYRIVVEGVVKIVNPEMISVFLYNEESKLLEKVAEKIGDVWVTDLDESYHPGESLTGKVYKSGVAKKINGDPTADPDYGPLEKAVAESDNGNPTRRELDLQKLPSGFINHYLGVPLMIANKPIGVIRAVNKKSGYYDLMGVSQVKEQEECLLRRGFSTDCATVLGIIASHLAVAIQNAKLINKLSGTISQLQTLTRVARRVSSNYEMEKDDLLHLIVRRAAEVTNAVICMLFLKDEQEEFVKLDQVFGMPKVEGLSYRLGEGKTGTVAQTGKAIVEPKLDPNHKGKYDHIVLAHLKELKGERTELESFMAAPIIIEDKSRVSGQNIIGVLKVINKLNSQPFNDDDGSIFETFASQIGVAIAIADRNVELTHLVGGVVHEINNTSGLIPTNISILRKQLGPISEATERTLKRIDQVTTAAVEFSNDLLGFSERQMKARKPRDINELIDEALEPLSSSTIYISNFDQVTFDPQYSTEPIMCNINGTPFIHIVRNIVVNAYHAMEGVEGGGRLEISTSTDVTGKIAHVKFVDNGHGITEEQMPRLFHADFSTKDSPKGNGLGLWLVKTYLRRMGGSITVESTAGHGATFEIRIPTTKQQQGEATDGETYQGVVGGGQ
jgi:signal transduction histidine kinase/CheY-like chemotaxis protein